MSTTTPPSSPTADAADADDPTPTSIPIRIPEELLTLPNEILVKIIKNLDVETIFQTVRCVNSHFWGLVAEHWPIILCSVIERDFQPVEPLFRVFDVCCAYAGERRGSSLGALDRIGDGEVWFKGMKVCGRSGGNGDSSGNGNGNGEGNGGMETRNWTTRLSSSDGLAVFKVCLTVKKWEREFQRLRFAGRPEHSRTLRPHELERLRFGLYVWWRYARYFHAPFCFGGEDDDGGGVGFGDQGRFWLRRPHVSPDIRCNFMRQYSTTQLHVISDVWDTIRSAVGREVCPSIVAVREPDYELSYADAARIGWGYPVENDVILSTMMKLAPEDILHLLMFRHRYATKASLIQFIRLKSPSIEQSIETFSEAIFLTISEREMMIASEHDPHGLEPGYYFPIPSGFPYRYGGVVDFPRAQYERLRDVYEDDAGRGVHYCPDGIDEEDAAAIYYKGKVHTGMLVPTQ